MKIVFMGTPDFAVPPLKALVEAGYDVPRILTAGLQVADEKLNGADKEEEE